MDTAPFHPARDSDCPKVHTSSGHYRSLGFSSKMSPICHPLFKTLFSGWKSGFHVSGLNRGASWYSSDSKIPMILATQFWFPGFLASTLGCYLSLPRPLHTPQTLTSDQSLVTCPPFCLAAFLSFLPNSDLPVSRWHSAVSTSRFPSVPESQHMVTEELRQAWQRWRKSRLIKEKGRD